MLVVLLVTVSDGSLQSQCSCWFRQYDIITTTYTLTLACVLVCLRVCNRLLGCPLPGSLQHPAGRGWQGGWPDGMWVLDTVDIFGGGGVG